MPDLNLIQNRLNPVFREVIWLLPLLIVGAFRLMDYPLIVGAAVLAAFIPWLAGQFVFDRPFQRTPFDGPLLLLLIAAVAGLVVSYNFMLSLPALLTLLGSLGVYYIIVNSPLSPRQCAEGSVGVAALVAAYFLGQKIPVWPSVLFRLDANAAAGFVEVAFLPAIWLMWQARPSTRLIWGVITGVIGLALLVSGSRGAWLGVLFATGFGGVLFTSGRKRQFVVVALGVVGGLLAGLVGLFLFVPAHQLPAVLNPALESFDSRLALYQNSLYLWAEYPLTGVGLGDAFAQVYSRYRLLIIPDYLYYPHHLWLSMALSMGPIGMAAMLWLILRLYRFVAHIEMHTRYTSAPHYLFRAAWLSSFVPLIHGFMDSPHFSNHLWAMPMIFVSWGLVISTGRRLPVPSRRVPQRLFWQRPLVVAVAVAVFVGLIFSWRPLTVVWHLNWGALYQTKAELFSGDPAVLTRRAQTHFDKILALDPSQPTAHYRLGIMAMDREDFETAAIHFQTAHQQQPRNQAVDKALALAYRATGQVEQADTLFAGLNPHSGIITGPHLWRH